MKFYEEFIEDLMTELQRKKIVGILLDEEEM
jgi:hypothetical protein